MGRGAPKRDSAAPEASTNRVWQACVSCRRKKVKCDGQQPCHNCSSRDAVCEYPGSNDNASTSRQYAMSFEARCQQLDLFCQRLEGLAGQLSQTVETLTRAKAGAPSNFDEDELMQAANALRSLPEAGESLQLALDPSLESAPAEQQELTNITAQDSRVESDSEDCEDDDLDFSADQSSRAEKFGSLVTDSYGKLRFVGGATNSVLIEAIQSLSPGRSTVSDSPGILSVSRGTATDSTSQSIEIPLFVHGQSWPELPHLPKAEQLSRPPQYIADLLVNLYFDQLHYTFPVLHKPHFMSRFKQMNSSRASEPPDRRFLSVFFAVCACASSLLPSDGKSSRFSGLDYYEKALLLHYASHGEVSLEAVQCLALLAMCSAGWNTLTQSWNYAGRAVRAAQDLGMHLSSLMPSGLRAENDPAVVLRQQMSRRIWWSVYCIDRVTSICLGRPMAAQDSDCHCELPLDISDDDLEGWCRNPQQSPQQPSTSSSMTGFLAFARLCRIGGKIQQLYSPSRIREVSNPAKAKRYLRTIESLDRSLNEWLAGLPDDIRFSANNLDRSPDLTMCVIMFIVHAGSLLNLYRTLIGSLNQSLPGLGAIDAVSHCVSAARSCINAAELVRELVPPSHHLAFCVHYLTLSGLVLLRMPGSPRDQTLADVQKCVTFLKDLEVTWSGASKSRAIIEQLMRAPPTGSESLNKRSLAEFEETEAYTWDQVPGAELFTYDVSGADLLNAWLP